MHITRVAARFALATAMLSAAASPAWAQDYAALGAALFGEEVPGGGANDKVSADFDGEIDFANSSLCYYFEQEGLSGATEAHIHEGAKGKTGPVVVTLSLPGSDETCMMLEKPVLDRLAQKPDDFYIDIHSADHPDGAVRGQFKG